MIGGFVGIIARKSLNLTSVSGGLGSTGIYGNGWYVRGNIGIIVVILKTLTAIGIVINVILVVNG